MVHIRRINIFQSSTSKKYLCSNILYHPLWTINYIIYKAIDVLEKTLDDGFDTSFEPKEYIRIYTWV